MDNTPSTKNRAERRTEASKAKHGNALEHRNVRDPRDAPLSPAAETKSFTLIWEPELCEQLGRSRYTLQRWVRQGRFPPPIQVNSQNLAWRVRDVEAWLNKLARSRKKIQRRGSLMQGNELVRRGKREATNA